MLTIKTATPNPEKVRELIKTEPAPNNHGYTGAFYLYANGHRYTVEILNGARPFYVVSFTDPGPRTNYILSLDESTPDGIRLLSAEVYKDGNQARTRRETSEKLLMKYKQVAAIIQAAIICGLLTPEELPTASEEEPEQIKPEAKPERVRYTIGRYTTSTGADRVTFTRNNSKYTTIEAPAADLEQIKAEILKDAAGAVFIEASEAMTA